jgi:hypothetical protein
MEIEMEMVIEIFFDEGIKMAQNFLKSRCDRCIGGFARAGR